LSVPKGRGATCLPEFLQKRALLPRVEDPVEDNIELRLDNKNLLKPVPNAPRPVTAIFKLK